MKYYTLLFLLFSFSCQAQQTEHITTEIDYFPEKKDEISEENYRKAINTLNRTYEAIKKDSNHFNYMDHLNIATAFVMLKEPKEKVLNQFELAKAENLENTAILFPQIYSKESLIDYYSSMEYDSIVQKLNEITANKKEKALDIVAYAEQHQFDLDLVRLMADISEKDQKYRFTKDNWQKQQVLDSLNMVSIDSLYNQYLTYIGLKMVGKKFNTAMWAVIQHADLERQEFYLPIIHQAVKDGELASTPLKMLIDRIYRGKYGNQIFGSQSNGDLADDETIRQVKLKYGLE